MRTKWYTWFPVHVAAASAVTLLLSGQYFHQLFPKSGVVVELAFHFVFFLAVLYLVERMANGTGMSATSNDTQKDDAAS